MKIRPTLIALLTFYSTTNAQNYWQQTVDYKMDVDINVNTFRYSGKQELLYTNNSPCLLYTSPSPRDATLSRMPSSA